MNPHSDYEAFKSSSARKRRLLRQEELILEVTEALITALEREKVTKTELALRLGSSKAFVSQVLAGGRNLTLRTIADLADALGYRIHVRACKDADATTPLVRQVIPFIRPGLARWAEGVITGESRRERILPQEIAS